MANLILKKKMTYTNKKLPINFLNLLKVHLITINYSKNIKLNQKKHQLLKQLKF